MNFTEQCPLCGTELSKIKFAEIHAKAAEQERQTLLAQKQKIAEVEESVSRRLKQQFQKDLQKEAQAATKLARQEASEQVKQIADELDQAARKLKDAEAREVEIRKQAQEEKELAAKAARQQAEHEIKKISAERDQATRKVEEAKIRETEIRKQAQQEKDAAAKLARQQAEQEIKKIAAERDQATVKVKEAETRATQIQKQVEREAEKKRLEELGEQRLALEKEREMSLLKLQAGFNREREAFQKKCELMRQQLQKKTANELGDGAEIDLLEALHEAFADDRIKRIQKGQAGPDVVCEVIYKGQVCGKIVIDSKNRQGWQNAYVTKLRQDQVEAGAEHAILATTAFPAGSKEMCIDSDVIIVNPARVVHIVHILRQAMVTMHIRGLSMKERSGKMSKLYSLITSEAYACKFNEVGKLTQDILDLDVEEKKEHDKVWRKRGTAATRINNVLREIATEVAAVIEGVDDAEERLSYGAAPVKAASVKAASQERMLWNKG